jgi:asparagine synthase (glutamine-hydrolysing)
VEFSGRPPDEDLVRRMTATLRHRGPDDDGVHLSGPAGLGHTRLSIIDLSPNGHQPMISRDGRVAVIFNGEIYNFLDLRRELEQDGITFRSRSDTEVILEAYRRWGPAAFSRLHGMFALAIWDAARGELHAARDRFGIKPFYYTIWPSGLAFGSEIKAILAGGRLSRRMSQEALHEYLYYGAALGPRSLFEGAARLLPGHHLVFDRTGLRIRPYASIHDVEPVADDPDTAAGEIRRLLDRAVRQHLISDVPVGVFLSGGIDSSSITALATRHYGGRLNTYAVGFEAEGDVNELPKARAVAERFGTEHHELHVAGAHSTEVIESLVRSHDEPFADAANIPLYLLCRELKGSVKVVLQGDGGDEIFGGYRRYNVLSAERFWRLAARAAVRIAPLIPRSAAYHRFLRFFRAMDQADPGMRMALLLTEETLADPPTRLLAPEARAAMNGADPFARYREFYRRFSRLDPVQRMLYTDCSVMLPDIYLEKVDKSTMAHGIEVRVPMLDVELCRYVMGLPSDYKVRRGRKKWILRLAMRGIVPDAILDGKKVGFGVPFSYWLRGPLHGYMRSVLFDPATETWGLFDRRALEQAIEEHAAGRRDNGFLLWKALHLALWRAAYGITA